MLLLGDDYMRNNLARLRGYPTHGDVADMSDLFYFCFVFYDQWDDAFTEISPFEAKWDEQKSV